MTAALRRGYDARERRALNQVWTCAGEYGFEPLFLAFHSDGRPDLYMNSIVGCACALCGREALAGLFAAWEGDRRQAVLDDLAWLALESAAFAWALPGRPALETLRRARGEEFFAQEHTLSRQEWMAHNQLAYTMQTARWRGVLGRTPPVMTPRERALSAALECGGAAGEELPEKILSAFAQAGLFDGTARAGRALRLRLHGTLAALAARARPVELVKTDVVTVQRSRRSGEGGGPGLDARRARTRLEQKGEADRRYIESCFGKLLCAPEELAAAEQALCTGDHLGCRLWLTAGVPDPERAGDRDAKFLAEQAALQAGRNQKFFEAHGELYRSAILRLAEQVRECLQIHSQTDWEGARSGRLDSPRVWRPAVLGDGRVFLREVSSARPGFRVDLLLDASASRLHCQEEVAAQGYILSESLARCGVPVRVSSYCSLRGYTVLRVLKDFGERGGRKIFGYFASGWNRDGLVLRAAGSLLRGEPGERRLILLLTDASPNDSFRIPPTPGEPFGRDYADRPAVADAAREVRALRRRGLRVAAVFMGEDPSAPDAKTIYGRSLARIRRMDQLAAAAGALIQSEIRELSD